MNFKIYPKESKYRGFRENLTHPFFSQIKDDTVYYNVGFDYYLANLDFVAQNFDIHEAWETSSKVSAALNAASGFFQWPTTAGRIVNFLDFGYNVVIFGNDNLHVENFSTLKDYKFEPFVKP